MSVDSQKLHAPAPRGYRPPFRRAFLLPRYWGTWLSLGVAGLSAVLPRRFTMLMGAGLGWLFMRVNAKRRHIARVNLALCFPELDAQAREELLRRHYRVTGQAAMDLGLIWWGSRRRLERLVTFIGMEPVLARLERGENIIVLTGHFVGADFGGIYSSRNTDGIVMMKEMSNELFNWFVWRGRTRFGAEVTLRRNGLRPLLKALRSHRPCYYVPDEDFGPELSVFVPFFGIPTATITTLGRLAAAARAVVVPCWTRLEPDGRYEIEFGAAFEDYPSGDEEADAARMSLAIEEGIRKAPEQYMWTLKWFRSRPGGEPPPYDRPAP